MEFRALVDATENVFRRATSQFSMSEANPGKFQPGMGPPGQGCQPAQGESSRIAWSAYNFPELRNSGTAINIQMTRYNMAVASERTGAGYASSHAPHKT